MDPIFPDGLFVPEAAGVAVVVEEVDAAFRAPDGDDDFDLAVGVDDVLGPGGAGLAGVFVPGDEGDVGAGGENVGVAIAGKVGDADGADGHGEEGRDAR